MRTVAVLPRRRSDGGKDTAPGPHVQQQHRRERVRALLLQPDDRRHGRGIENASEPVERIAADRLVLARRNAGHERHSSREHEPRAAAEQQGRPRNRFFCLVVLVAGRPAVDRDDEAGGVLVSPGAGNPARTHCGPRERGPPRAVRPETSRDRFGWHRVGPSIPGRRDPTSPAFVHVRSPSPLGRHRQSSSCRLRNRSDRSRAWQQPRGWARGLSAVLSTVAAASLLLRYRSSPAFSRLQSGEGFSTRPTDPASAARGEIAGACRVVGGDDGCDGRETVLHVRNRNGDALQHVGWRAQTLAAVLDGTSLPARGAPPPSPRQVRGAGPVEKGTRRWPAPRPRPHRSSGGTDTGRGFSV